MKIRFLNMILLLFFSLPGKSNITGQQETANRVLDQLFEKSGYPDSKKPKLLLSDKTDKVAAYYPALNTIIFEQKAYQICTSLGKDSLSAIAFLLGHELAHAFQTEIKNRIGATNFLSYDRHYDGGVRVEKTADIQGAFSAYLAGYSVFSILPDLFERLYEEYNLKGKNIQGYPSLYERKATGKEVEKIVINLIDLYENAGYLTSMGKFGLAKDCYEYILRYYQSREVYNNLGILYVFNALENYNSATDNFIHPLRMDASALMQNPKLPRGSTLSNFKRKLRARFLKKAEKNFEIAVKIDPNYNLAKVNLMSVYNLSEQQDKTVFFYSNRFKNGHPEEAKMALALSYLTKDVYDKSGRLLLDDCLNSNDIIVKNQADYNIKRTGEQAIAVSGKAPLLPLPKFVGNLIESIFLGRNTTVDLLYLSEENDTYFSKAISGATSVFSFEKPEELTYTFKRMRLKKAARIRIFDKNSDLKKLYYRNLIPLNNGFYLLDPGNRFILKVNSKGRLEEVIRIFSS